MYFEIARSLSLAAIVALSMAHAAAAAAPDGKPYNFIVMMADDLGAKELACYGNAANRTPNLDRLAQQGMRFETCYATPICSSTRLMIMTGQYGFRTGYFTLMGRPYTPLPTSADFDVGSKITFADVLKPAGYRTGLAGKWQLSGRVPTLVHDCGFDEYRIWAYKGNLPAGAVHTGAWESEATQKTARYWHPCIMQNGELFPTSASDYGPDLYSDFAVDFVRRHKDEPFFFYYPMALTHGPHDPTPDLAHPGQKTASGMKTNVEYMDHVVGKIVAAVDDLGLAERTIILFTGDNGTGGDGKGTVTELGARVPMIVRCPGTVQTGVTSDELVDLTDVLPTLADLAGVEPAKNHTIDGHSLAPTLRGSSEPHREWIYSYIATGKILRDKRWLIEVEDGQTRLYDCSAGRNGQGYKDVSDATDPEVVAARTRLEGILATLPGPENHPGLRQPSEADEAAAKAKRGGKNKNRKRKATRAAS